jgi:TatD DNase family protein
LKKFSNIWPALGLHPLRALESKKELKAFQMLATKTEYIGEIGLDLSKEGKETSEIQWANIRSIIPLLGKGKFVSVHSRNAHKEMFTLLKEQSLTPVSFHYYTGDLKTLELLLSEGHYFSINHQMFKKNLAIIERIPKSRILVETDAPFLTQIPIKMINSVYEDLGKLWKIDKLEVEKRIFENFKSCRTN